MQLTEINHRVGLWVDSDGVSHRCGTSVQRAGSNFGPQVFTWCGHRGFSAEAVSEGARPTCQSCRSAEDSLGVEPPL